MFLFTYEVILEIDVLAFYLRLYKIRGLSAKCMPQFSDFFNRNKQVKSINEYPSGSQVFFWSIKTKSPINDQFVVPCQDQQRL